MSFKLFKPSNWATTNPKTHLNRQQPLLLSLQDASINTTHSNRCSVYLEQCKYGFSCCHLRSMGKCVYLHRSAHYLLLNLVPSSQCLPDLKMEQTKSKRQKKELKIFAKAIADNTDVQQIELADTLVAEKEYVLEEKDLIVVRLAKCKDIEELYRQLTTVREGVVNVPTKVDLHSVVGKALMQLKKNNPALYSEYCDKGYRISSRLIKHAQKFQKFQDLEEIYLDINYDTAVVIKEWYLQYFQAEKGMPISIDPSTIYFPLRRLINKVFKLRQEDLLSRSIISISISKEELLANADFYNMVVPHCMARKLPFGKYYCVDSERITLTAFSQIIAKEFFKDFSSRCKSIPEYPFGDLESNWSKFEAWTRKIKAKYSESGASFTIILVLSDFDRFLDKNTVQQKQLEAENLKQSIAVLRTFIEIFSPSIVYLASPNKMQFHRELIAKFDLETVVQWPKDG